MRLLISVCLVLLVGFVALPVYAVTQNATVTWTAPTVNPSSVTGYQVLRKTGTTGMYAQVGTTGATVLTFSDPGLAQGNTYCYAIVATGTAGNSPQSADGCANTVGTPGAPGQPTVTITFGP